MLSKSKNIVKQLEGCSKSHFSHIRNKVEKVTLGPLILEWFLNSKSCQDQEKVVSKSIQKSGRFSIRFFIDLGSIWEPTGHPKIVYFSSNFALGVALGQSWRQEGAQSAPRQLQRSIFQKQKNKIREDIYIYIYMYVYIYIYMCIYMYIYTCV